MITRLVSQNLFGHRNILYYNGCMHRTEGRAAGLVPSRGWQGEAPGLGGPAFPCVKPRICLSLCQAKDRTSAPCRTCVKTDEYVAKRSQKKIGSLRHRTTPPTDHKGAALPSSTKKL